MVLFPTNFAAGIDFSGTSRIIDTPLLMSFASSSRAAMVNAAMKTSGSASKAAGAGVRRHSYKPYDVAVTAARLIAKHHWRELLEITSAGSDTQWLGCQLVCQLVLGYGASFRFVPKWRPPISWGKPGTEPVNPVVGRNVGPRLRMCTQVVPCAPWTLCRRIWHMKMVRAAVSLNVLQRCIMAHSVRPKAAAAPSQFLLRISLVGKIQLVFAGEHLVREVAQSVVSDGSVFLRAEDQAHRRILMGWVQCSRA